MEGRWKCHSPIIADWGLKCPKRCHFKRCRKFFMSDKILVSIRITKHNYSKPQNKTREYKIGKGGPSNVKIHVLKLSAKVSSWLPSETHSVSNCYNKWQQHTERHGNQQSRRQTHTQRRQPAVQASDTRTETRQPAVQASDAHTETATSSPGLRHTHRDGNQQSRPQTHAQRRQPAVQASDTHTETRQPAVQASDAHTDMATSSPGLRHQSTLRCSFC